MWLLHSRTATARSHPLTFLTGGLTLVVLPLRSLQNLPSGCDIKIKLCSTGSEADWSLFPSSQPLRPASPRTIWSFPDSKQFSALSPPALLTWPTPHNLQRSAQDPLLLHLGFASRPTLIICYCVTITPKLNVLDNKHLSPHTVSKGQVTWTSSAARFWLRDAHEVVAKMLPKA